jgi:hypothetical protein
MGAQRWDFRSTELRTNRTILSKAKDRDVLKRCAPFRFQFLSTYP